MTSPDPQWEHHYIETNNIRLHCVAQGEGDLVILLHGFPEFWYSWRYQIPALARYFKVVVPDLRGYNDSDKPNEGYDLNTLSADIKGLIERFGYLKAHIVGHDWGGIVAWHIAQKFPELINRLVVLNAPHPRRFGQEILTNLDQVLHSWYVFAFQLPGLPEWFIQHNLKSFVDKVFREQAVRKAAFTAENLQIYQEALQKPRVLNAALNYYRQLITPQFWQEYWGRNSQPIKVPTLVLWGEDDSFLSKKMVNGLEQLIAAPFQLKTIPDCGHWIQQEAPQIVNRELLNFLLKKKL